MAPKIRKRPSRKVSSRSGASGTSPSALLASRNEDLAKEKQRRRDAEKALADAREDIKTYRAAAEAAEATAEASDAALHKERHQQRAQLQVYRAQWEADRMLAQDPTHLY